MTEILTSQKYLITHFESDFSGGRRYKENPFTAQILWQRAQATLFREQIKPQFMTGKSYEQQILLAEIALLYPYLDADKQIIPPEEILQYVMFNEQTAMTEAITAGVVSQTFRRWCPELNDCVAYGYPTLPMYHSGVKEAKRLESQNENVHFEVRRREVELVDAQVLNEAISRGILDTHFKISISPYPDDIDDANAGKLGYFAQDHAAMIRIFDYNPETRIVTTTQIRVAGSNQQAFENLIQELKGYEGSLVVPISPQDTPPTQILATQIYVPKDRIERGIIQIAQIYDQELEKLTGESYYLGSPSEHKEYDQLWTKTVLIQNDLQGLVQDLVNIDIALAESLKKGQPTPNIQQLLTEALNLNSNALDPDSRKILDDIKISGFNEHSAAILKKLQLIKTLGIAAALVNPQKADQILGQTNADYIRSTYYADPDCLRDNPHILALIAEVKPEFYFCGAVIKGQRSSSDNILMNQPLSEIKETLFGGEGKFVKKCGQCGISIEAIICKGYRCKNCGGTYQGC